MSDVDLNAIKAGEYELTALRWDQITSKPGQPLDFVRHRQGDMVTLNVEDARRLVVAGAVRKPGDEGKEPEVPGAGPSVAPSGDGSEDPDGGVSEYDPAKANVEEVLAYVGEDQSLAAAALEYEEANKARSTLLEKLKALANPGA